MDPDQLAAGDDQHRAERLESRIAFFQHARIAAQSKGIGQFFRIPVSKCRTVLRS
jgi:hypothetical protein